MQELPVEPRMSLKEGRSILIVDDDRPAADTLSRMLQLEGFRVSMAADANAGLKMAESGRPDAIILDLRMPLISGLQLLRQLRENPDLGGVPVTIVTGDYFLGDRMADEIRSLGASIRFKPLWLEELVALARSMLSA